MLSYHNLNIGVSEAVIKVGKFFQKNKIKTTILYNGVDTTKFYPVKEAFKEGVYNWLCGQFWKLKDQITLLKSCRNFYF